MSRLPKWRGRLVAYIDEMKRTPYRDGQHDCALFAAGAVAAMTGEDYAAAYRGRYTTIRGGLRILRRDGFRDHVALAAAVLPEVAPGLAQPGDLAVVPGRDELPSLGVVQGEWVYVLTLAGLGHAPLSTAERAFRV